MKVCGGNPTIMILFLYFDLIFSIAMANSNRQKPKRGFGLNHREMVYQSIQRLHIIQRLQNFTNKGNPVDHNIFYTIYK